MKNKKGFTLTELLVCIALLSIIGGIIIYNMANISKTNKETEYKRYVATIKASANVYADLNPDAFNELYSNKAYVVITIEELIKSGLIDANIKNPYTNQTPAMNEELITYLDPETGSLEFIYPIEIRGNNTEVINPDKDNEGTNSSNQVPGTPSSNTDNNVSSLNPDGPASIIQGIRDKEVFLAAMADYVVYGENYNCMQGAGSYELALSKDDGTLIMLNNEENLKKYNFSCKMPEGFNSKDPRNYKVEYTWITETGKKRKATRTLRVLPQVKPTVKFNNNYVEGTWYTPTYDKEKNTWNYLTFTPTLEGMDPANAVVRITKQSLSPAGNIEKVTVNPTNNDFISEFNAYNADDGDKTYYIDTIVTGHHDKSYSYIAKGSVNIKQQLVIIPSLVTGVGNDYNTTKTITIKDTYSPVGIKEYEYRLSNSQDPITKNNYVERINAFPYTTNSTNKTISIFSNSCTPKKNEYKYLFVRAINKDGYVGEWSDAIEIYLTNQLDLIISGDNARCNGDSNVCCKSSGSTCYYTAATKFLTFGNNKMTILGKDNTSKVLAAYSSVLNNRITPTTIKSDIAYVKTCDGMYTTRYEYSTPVLNVITDEAQSFLSALPSNYADYIQYRKWENYTSYVGVPSKGDADLYKGALADNVPYWTTTTYITAFQIYVHYTYNTRYNTYYYAVDGNQVSSKYAGTSAYIKPMLSFKTSYVCSGEGTSIDPYVIAY